jgi:hypothetical protein
MVGRRQPDVAGLVEVRVRLLGAFQVNVGGAAVPERWRLRKARTLIKMLALAPKVDRPGHLAARARVVAMTSSSSGSSLPIRRDSSLRPSASMTTR